MIKSVFLVLTLVAAVAVANISLNCGGKVLDCSPRDLRTDKNGPVANLFDANTRLYYCKNAQAPAGTCTMEGQTLNFGPPIQGGKGNYYQSGNTFILIRAKK